MIIYTVELLLVSLWSAETTSKSRLAKVDKDVFCVQLVMHLTFWTPNLT